MILFKIRVTLLCLVENKFLSLQWMTIKYKFTFALLPTAAAMCVLFFDRDVSNNRKPQKNLSFINKNVNFYKQFFK